MAFPAPGRYGPQALTDSAGNALSSAVVTPPAGYTATVDELGNLTVEGPPGDAVALTVTPPGRPPLTVTVAVPPAVADLDVAAQVAAAEARASSTYVPRTARPVAISNVNPLTGDGTTTTFAGTFRTPHRVAVAAKELRLVFTNHSTSGSGSHPDIDNTSAINVNASIEVAGTIYRATFGGRTTGVIDGGGTVVTDPIGVEVAAGDVVYSRDYITGTSWYRNRVTVEASGNGGFGAGDTTAPGSGAIADGSTNWKSASALLGTPNTVTAVVAGIGDSILDGAGDNTANGITMGSNAPSGAWGGYLARALSGVLPHVNLAQSGDQAQYFAAKAGHFRRLATMELCGVTHAVCGYGTNDLSSSRTLAQIQADLLTVWGLLKARGVKVYQATMVPRSTSTDSWATVENQTTQTYNATRVSLNEWIRAGAPTVAGAAVAVGTSGALTAGQDGHPLTGYFDVADAVESARNSGKWAAGMTWDGTHPKTVGHVAMAAVVTPATFTV